MEGRRPPNQRNFGPRRRPTTTARNKDRGPTSGSHQGSTRGDRARREGNRTLHDARSGRPTAKPPWYRNRSDESRVGAGGRFHAQQQRSKPRPRKSWDTGEKIKIVSDLQITDGKLRGRSLQPLPFSEIQSTDRRLRDTLFKFLARRIRAARVLDICTGNGIIGFEALSRGAMCVTFVERSTRACSVIKKNLELCEIRDGRCDISPLEALPFLARVKRQRKFWDFVYFGPPYDTDYTNYLKHFGNGVSIRPGGVLVIEHRAGVNFPDTIGLLTKRRVIVNKDTAATIFERK